MTHNIKDFIRLNEIVDGACPKCGALLPAGTKYCPSCGRPIVRPCPSCGKPTPSSGRHCKECGSWLGGEELKTAEVGDRVSFGVYRCEAKSDYVEPILWRVLASEEGRILLISEYGIDLRRFNRSGRGNEWDTSELKTWLEQDFAFHTFSEGERAVIGDGPFCLSVDEVKEHLPSKEARTCERTDYAYRKSLLGNNMWWLRSPSENDASDVSCVLENGAIGVWPGGCECCVRPALWVKVDE